MTQRRSVRTALLVVGSLFVTLVSTLGVVRRAGAGPRTVVEIAPVERPQPVPPPRARLWNGTIVRDAASEEAIRATAHLTLPRIADPSRELVVTKSRYRLDVYEAGRLLKAYPVALGREPVGNKRMEGDNRTPEGRYPLIPHHPSPNFGSSFYVCYPAPADASRALVDGLIEPRTWLRVSLSHKLGLQPPSWTGLGGLILIHGTRDRSQSGLTQTNWTRGCIAMENEDLEELLTAFSPEDRPHITIRP